MPKLKNRTMRIFLIIILLIIPLDVYSQFNIYTEEWVRERDEIIYDDHSAGAAAKSARSSLWSLSGPQNDWVRPTYNTTNGYGTERIVTKKNAALGISISTEPSSTEKVISRGTKKAGNRNRYDKCVENRRRMQAEAEERKRKEELRKRQLKEQDNARAAAVSSQYMQKTENFYSEKAQWDHSAEKRAMELMNMHPVEAYMDLPEAKEVDVKFRNKKSGKKIAAMFDKQKEKTEKNVKKNAGNILCLDEYTRKSNASIESDKSLRLFEREDVNYDDYNAWSEVLNSETCVVESIDKNSSFAIDVKETVSTENKALVRIFELEDTMETDKFLACGERVFYKEGDRIIEIGDSTYVFMKLDTEEFNISPHTDSTFYITATKNDLTVIADVNINNKTYNELVKVPIDVVKIISNGNITLIVTPYEIVQFMDSESLELFWQSDDEINDACFCEIGILVATDKAVYMFESEDRAYEYIQSGAKKVWVDKYGIYAQISDKRILYITNN